uniref:uncharacterized protein LOC120327001 isoform X2 n=1 Tax=Styela clava TaxID=7725 RepID=UPI00193994F5|nr:uncharacterized protein LOC120327001 isoform X2 [Styela clava]
MEKEIPKDISFGGNAGSSSSREIFVFTAEPKLLEKKKCLRGHLRSSLLKKTPRKPVSSRDIDLVSGLFGKLEVAKVDPKKTKEKPGENVEVVQSGIDEDLVRPSSTSFRLRSRTVRQARRRLKADVVESMNVASPQLWDQSFGKNKKQNISDEKVFFRATGGFYRIPFAPPDGTDDDTKQRTKHQCISAIPYYQNKSMEEIRFEDYVTGRKGPITITHYGPKFRECIGTDINMRNSQRITTHHQCISAMTVYEQNSLEELRIEHYMPSTGWRDREKYSLTQKKMQQLPITLNSKVYIFQENEREEGIVQFIGKLPDKPNNKIYLGLDLKDPVGIGDGCYKNLRLFRTAKYHAKFVPLDAALPGYLFDDDTHESSRNKDTETELPIAKSLPSTKETDKACGSSSSSSKETNVCAVCLTNPISIFFLPCGHVCCCERCSKKMRDCPLCRKSIKAKHKAYLA